MSDSVSDYGKGIIEVDDIANSPHGGDQKFVLLRILIAEDEESLATLYKVLLSKFGYEVIDVVRSGEEAIARYAKTKPDVVIMDHRLERKSGLDALKEILKIDPKAIVIFASADDSVMEDAIAAGAADYIAKPFSMQELVEVIGRCVA